MYTKFKLENLKGRDHLENLDGRWEDLKEIGCWWVGVGGGGVDWINLTQDKNWWQALVNIVMNLLVP
jgi:hypothetical protein